MKKQAICVMLAVVLFNGPLLLAAAEEDRIKALEEKIEAMQAMYENRIQSLETRIDYTVHTYDHENHRRVEGSVGRSGPALPECISPARKRGKRRKSLQPLA